MLHFPPVIKLDDPTNLVKYDQESHSIVLSMKYTYTDWGSITPVQRSIPPARHSIFPTSAFHFNQCECFNHPATANCHYSGHTTNEIGAK
jgi:hypothetical protein